MEQPDLRNLLAESIRLFRLGMEAHGSTRLKLAIDLLIVQLPKLSEIECRNIQIQLGHVLSAQERRDFLWVADLLEYQVIPILTSYPMNDERKR